MNFSFYFGSAWAGPCIIIFLFFLTGCVTTEYNVGTHKQDVMFYSSEKEIAMGRNIAKQISQEFKLSNSPYDLERISKISEKIVEVVDREAVTYYFYVIEEDSESKSSVNAFSLPGGYIYIFKELMDLLDDDELAFVLSHEVGHVVSRHHIKRLQAAIGYNFLMAASAAASRDANFNQGLSYALAQIMMGYSREDEFNADMLAAKYCEEAGFDAASGIGVMEKLYRESKDKIRPYSYLRSHPYHSQRIGHLKEAIGLPLDVDDYINY